MGAEPCQRDAAGAAHAGECCRFTLAIQSGKCNGKPEGARKERAFLLFSSRVAIDSGSVMQLFFDRGAGKGEAILLREPEVWRQGQRSIYAIRTGLKGVRLLLLRPAVLIDPGLNAIPLA